MCTSLFLCIVVCFAVVTSPSFIMWRHLEKLVGEELCVSASIQRSDWGFVIRDFWSYVRLFNFIGCVDTAELMRACFHWIHYSLPSSPPLVVHIWLLSMQIVFVQFCRRGKRVSSYIGPLSLPVMISQFFRHCLALCLVCMDARFFRLG